MMIRAHIVSQKSFIEYQQTCDSLNLTSGLDTSPARSCSMYSNTRYMLLDNREVISPSNFMMFGWSSLRRIIISRAINLMLSGWKLSTRTFFSATILPLSTSRARNTLLYVPCPIYLGKNKSFKKGTNMRKKLWRYDQWTTYWSISKILNAKTTSYDH